MNLVRGMSIMKRSHKSLPCTLLLAAIFGGCLKDEENPQGTEVENELAGTLYLADGKPAAGAKVKIYPVNHNPDPTAVGSPVYSAVTDEKGHYLVDSLSRGEYNILGEKDSLLSYQDSVFVSTRKGSLPPDTLRGSGSITGYVALQPQDNFNRRSVSVQVMGTNVFVNADEDGRFVLPRLAEGEYTVHLTTTLPEYAPLFASLKAESGVDLELPDTLRIPYTGIPAVQGLRLAYDTSASVAQLSWNRTKYSNAKEFLVYRSVAGDLSLSKVLVGRTMDTVFKDTLFRPWKGVFQGVGVGIIEPDAYPVGAVRSFPYGYTVILRSRSEANGPVFEEATVEAVTPSLVKTYMDLGIKGATVHSKTISIGDTVKIFVNYYNRTRFNRSLQWFRSGVATPLRTIEISAKQGSDTIVFVAADAEERITFRVQATDQAGRLWTDSTYLDVVKDRPIVNAGKDTIITKGDNLRLVGSARQSFGSFVKWEWDIGNTGTFKEAPGGEVVINLPGFGFQVTCVLRVTDDDGLAGSDTVLISVANSRLRSPMITPRDYFALVETKGKLFAIGGKTERLNGAGNWYVEVLASVESYNPETDSWKTCKSMKYPRHSLGAASIEGRIYVLGGSNNGAVSNRLESYDPDADAWTDIFIPKIVDEGDAYLLGSTGGKLHVLVRGWNKISRLYDYDPAVDIWTERIWNADPLELRWSWHPSWHLASVEWKGKLLIVLGWPQLRLVEYDPVTADFRILVENLYTTGTPGVAMLNGQVVVLGGLDGPFGKDGVVSFNPEKGFEPTFLPSLSLPRGGLGAIAVGPSIFIMGGSTSYNKPINVVEEYGP